ncbi:unnamed protein product [Mytilus coruscus]|uniref:Globin domain-containing protein n=1 Tax=Mytilus coruscus TaxID=42192 RepID=A0A6J8BN42_MYTCO|nr:unnamed protein product [Mytilus coruscus]
MSVRKALVFSKDEIRALKESWYVLWGDKTNNGIKMLMKLFKMHPESRAFYKEFKDLREQDMPANKRFRGLALSYMYKLTEYIDAVDDPDTLEDLMVTTCKAHHRRGLGPKHFKWMGSVMTSMVKETMKSTYLTELHKTSWTKLMDALVVVATDVQKTLKEESLDKIQIPEMTGVWRSPHNSPRF